MVAVTMTCMTTKRKFEVEDPAVVRLSNGRYAYYAEVPWLGKRGQTLVAYKFASHNAYLDYTERVQESRGQEGVEDVEEEDAVVTSDVETV